MRSAEELLEENAALVTLLRTCRKPDTWCSIADLCAHNHSAVRVLEHRIDPRHVHLVDDDDHAVSGNDDVQDSLFRDDEIPPVAEEARRLRAEWDIARRLVRDWSDSGLDFVSIFDDRYPLRLRTIVDMPPFVFADGLLNPEDSAVSVVGSRHCSPEGALFARRCASMLVDRRMTVVAGLADGIDSEAHREALRRGGRTVAFIGTGINRVYPATNRDLQRLIASPQSGGLVLSQFWPDTPPTKSTFPMRNALMSGYGMVSVVVEASEYSGTRIQARQSQRHGRPVILHRMVVEHTDWGRALAGKPGVHVVGSVDEVEKIIDRLLNFKRNLDDLIEQTPNRDHTQSPEAKMQEGICQ
ncbi:DNA-processing protein DprA [Bifidobacterium samirii]|uniref:DNA processing protein DprA n=1 Tax=Bifidobacterium samirii TaxID=2306974 RepID=A0A430FVU5_9BIFI|nr:DNA-processing protein DprA [Bifidobacterium samirii]RSX58058.1 DNA processing protein DprA [Bifidobacterium samirii]